MSLVMDHDEAYRAHMYHTACICCHAQFKSRSQLFSCHLNVERSHRNGEEGNYQASSDWLALMGCDLRARIFSFVTWHRLRRCMKVCIGWRDFITARMILFPYSGGIPASPSQRSALRRTAPLVANAAVPCDGELFSFFRAFAWNGHAECAHVSDVVPDKCKPQRLKMQLSGTGFWPIVRGVTLLVTDSSVMLSVKERGEETTHSASLFVFSATQALSCMERFDGPRGKAQQVLCEIDIRPLSLFEGEPSSRLVVAGSVRFKET